MKWNARKRAEFDCKPIQSNADNKLGGYKQKNLQFNADSCDSFGGKIGVFTKIENDFTQFNNEQANKEQQKQKQTKQQNFIEDPHWTRERRKQVKKCRFAVCSLALLAMTLGQMSRIVLNMALVEMTKSGNDSTQNATIDDTIVTTTIDTTNLTLAEFVEDTTPLDSMVTTTFDTTTFALPEFVEVTSPLSSMNDDNLTNETYQAEAEDGDEESTLDYSIGQQNLLLSAFYIGYVPSMLLNGNVAELYGSKYPLLIAISGSAIINCATPIVAGYNFIFLFMLRVSLGLVQGGLMPCMYDLFNKWLTMTETSIFIPLVKVSSALGILIGAMLPGISSLLELGWPSIFYMASSFCFFWSILWILLATSTPQTNRFVEINECQWIMRKKQPFSFESDTNLKLDAHQKKPASSSAVAGDQSKRRTSTPKNKLEESTPWLLIATNPSVLALTLVKFTYNIAMDFLFIELSLYLKKVHQASTETVSAVASSGALLQMSLITFAGWLAQVLVERQAFGVSRTKWRKIFQGSSNFLMASVYFIIPSAGSDLNSVIVLIMLVYLFYVLGSGGESMVPYDLSSRYPATICGMAHSISVLSGVTVPMLATLVISKDGSDIGEWNLLFYIIGCGCTLGGVVFCFVLKSKPFLPGEIEPKPGSKKISKGQP